MAERQTYEDRLLAQGIIPKASYRCVCCGHVGEAFTMAAVEPEDGFPAGVNFACSTCILDVLRTQAAHAAAAAAVNVVDWSPYRAHRDALLARCDWTQGADSPLDDATKEIWRTYRQQLRDVFSELANPDAIVWPDPPA